MNRSWKHSVQPAICSSHRIVRSYHRIVRNETLDCPIMFDIITARKRLVFPPNSLHNLYIYPKEREEGNSTLIHLVGPKTLHTLILFESIESTLVFLFSFSLLSPLNPPFERLFHLNFLSFMKECSLVRLCYLKGLTDPELYHKVQHHYKGIGDS